MSRGIVRLTGSRIGREIGSRIDRPVDLHDLVTRIAHAERVLDWRPRVGLSEGLERTITAYASHAEILGG